MTSKQIATHIADSAVEQGLSIEGVRTYQLTTADEDYIRSEWEEGLDVDRTDLARIEELVRAAY